MTFGSKPPSDFEEAMWLLTVALVPAIGEKAFATVFAEASPLRQTSPDSGLLVVVESILGLSHGRRYLPRVSPGGSVSTSRARFEPYHFRILRLEIERSSEENAEVDGSKMLWTGKKETTRRKKMK